MVPHIDPGVISPSTVNNFVFVTETMFVTRGRQRREVVHIVRLCRLSNGLMGAPADAHTIELVALQDYIINTGDDGVHVR